MMWKVMKQLSDVEDCGRLVKVKCFHVSLLSYCNSHFVVTILLFEFGQVYSSQHMTINDSVIIVLM
ncbi:hypothetical protein HanRHA438_Chr02g0095191 [Helianthus annuus]|uniref:Uncharacterized protein n=1 Tax=Helianthus annuus TaxID=4232 RepID=A0A9K3P0C1_HELAN|nr:hypothetical protein HanXRQr2_Chr02g0083771 [Helianthus annuus]KAJ0617010.1 hypothetical protein HanIR_Chr02g0096811 [Helianthus annuus]KAJ0941500.1 hypothetical protein HanRHA438_Chr02g0095191 [Helianthus annuus]KAJ0953196.1 hypothetical protein HanPSC8_Chr02g0081141 [Helianthus annuus]